MKATNYFKANSFRAPVVDTVVPFVDGDRASTDAAWARVHEVVGALAYKTETGALVVPSVMAWRRPALSGAWDGVEVLL